MMETKKRDFTEKAFLEAALSGQTTVYTALALTAALSLIAGLMQGAVYSGARAEADIACRLASEASFSGYHDALFEQYGIFAIRDNDHVRRKCERILKENLRGNEPVSLVSLTISDLTHMTEQNGEPIRTEVLACMKNGAAVEMLSDVSDAQMYAKQYQRWEASGEVIEALTKADLAVEELLSEELDLLPELEGIEVKEGIISRSQGRAVATGRPCLKTAVGGTIDQSSVGVTAGPIFSAIKESSPGYVNCLEYLEDMERAVEDNRPDAYYSAEKELLQALEGSLKAAENAWKMLQGPSQKTEVVQEAIQSAEGIFQENAQYLDDETNRALQDSLQDVQQMQENGSGLFDRKALGPALETRHRQLERVLSILKALDFPDSPEQKDAWKEKGHLLVQICTSFDNKALTVDYTGIDFESEADSASGVQDLIKFITGKKLELLVGDAHISDASMELSGRAGELAGTKGPSPLDKVSLHDLAEEALYNEYLFLQFDTWTDANSTEGSGNPKTELAYPLEYIVSGKGKDSENLNAVAEKLLLMRMGENSIYLLTDFAKREEALTLACSLLGFTGNAPIIKGAQILILTAWAYAEAMVDVRMLLADKKINLLKTKENWHTSLAQIMALDLPEGTEDEYGLGYEGFLRILLMGLDHQTKYYRTMGAMESGIIAGGETDFRMREFLYSFSGEALFFWAPEDRTFTEEIGYSYA